MTDWTNILKHASPDVRELNADVLDEPARKPQQAQTTGKPATDTNALSRKFETLWQAHGGPVLDAEVRFHPTRGWLLDYCHLATKIAIELEGGVYKKRYYKDGRFAGYGGRHMTPSGFVEDCRKYLDAHLLGYTVMRLATGMVTPDNVQRIIAHIRSVEASRP